MTTVIELPFCPICLYPPNGGPAGSGESVWCGNPDCKLYCVDMTEDEWRRLQARLCAKNQKHAAFVSTSCKGEVCKCNDEATHKIEETIQHDDPEPNRHPLTAYVCCDCFKQLMGQCRHEC